MEPPPRTGPPPIVTSYLIPAALLGVVLAVLMDRGRFPTDDRIILIAVLTIAARIYLRNRLLIAAALAFAIAAWAMDANGVPGWVEATHRRASAGQGAVPAWDGEDAWERELADRRIGDEMRIYGFAVVNVTAFAALLAGAWALRRRRTALHDPSARD